MSTKVNNSLFGIMLVCGIGMPGITLADLGNFNITKACPATKSLHANDNPGNVTVKSGETYPAVNLNKPGGAYILLRIPDAQPNLRWVDLSCGGLVNAPAIPGSGQVPTGGENSASSNPGKFLLSASWQPAFCESPPGQGKKECVTETDQRFDATHFTLHGLWPQPKGNFYCKVSGSDKRNDEDHHWDNLPAPVISPEAQAGLEQIMPGVQSNLQRHEWIKHGTCFGTGPEAYFRTANSLIGQLNNSQLQRFVQSNIGNEVDISDLKNAFEQTFGPGSAVAMVIECSNDHGRMLISGFSVNLQGVLSQATELKGVLDTSKPSKPKCAKGVIDRVGAN